MGSDGEAPVLNAALRNLVLMVAVRVLLLYLFVNGRCCLLMVRHFLGDRSVGGPGISGNSSVGRAGIAQLVGREYPGVAQLLRREYPGIVQLVGWKYPGIA